MGFIGDAVHDAFEWVNNIVSDVWDVVGDLVTVVGRGLSDPYVQLIIAGVFGTLAGVDAVTDAWTWASYRYATGASAASAIWSGVTAFTQTFVAVLASDFKAFLEAIRFKSVLAVHSTGMMVSKSYREAMADVYKQFGRVSKALGFWPQFISLAVRNSRTLVLDASTSMGRRYDLAEVEWLTELNGTLEKISAKMSAYKNNPEDFLVDLDRWLIAPAANRKGWFMENLLWTLDSLTNTTETVVRDVLTISDDVARFVADLPDNIKSQIEPHTKPITDKIDSFIDETYLPKITRIAKGLDKMMGGLSLVDAKAAAIEDRIRKPGTYLSEIDGLSGEERRYQEMLVYDYSTRYLDDQKGEIGASTREIEEGLERVRKEVVTAKPFSERWPKEIERPARPAGVPAELHKTWFVGDY